MAYYFDNSVRAAHHSLYLVSFFMFSQRSAGRTRNGKWEKRRPRFGQGESRLVSFTGCGSSQALEWGGSPIHDSIQSSARHGPHSSTSRVASLLEFARGSSAMATVITDRE